MIPHFAFPPTIFTSLVVSVMPKVKRIRSAALAGQSTRHAPLGQVIQDDTDRKKYAAIRSRRLGNEQDDDGDDVLTEKESRRIIELGREQQLEMQAEESRSRSRRQEQNSNEVDSEEEEYEEEEVESIVMDEE